MPTSSEQQYIDLYRQARQILFSHSAEVMNALRDQAFNDFEAHGFPTKKVERYKYTDLQQLFMPDYGLNLNRFHIPVDPYHAFRCDVPNLSTLLYFVVNDSFYHHNAPSKSSPTGGQGGRGLLPEGVIVGSLKEEAEKNPALISRFYGQLAKTDDDGVTALNTMLAQDGIFIYVPKHVKMDRAIQVVNILKSPFTNSHHITPGNAGVLARKNPQITPHRGAGGPSFMTNRRVLIVVEEDAEAKLLFCDHADDDSPFLTTQVTEAFVAQGASLDLYCMEETHAQNVRISNVYVEQQTDSRLNHNIITLHNGVTRNRLDLVFKGEGAECALGGCVVADKHQHVDNNTLITHAAPHCTSSQLYKYVLDGQATGAFAGKVYVAHGAQKTVSQMTNQNLCATRTAHMFTQPMLEIYADDVKCAHGSTVGQLNDAALFYMRQRGIPLQEAKTLLQIAFVGEVIDRMELQPLRDRLHYLVEQRFRGLLNKCAGCKLCR